MLSNLLSMKLKPKIRSTTSKMTRSPLFATSWNSLPSILPVDPPIAMVSRLISSFDKVSSCRRKKNEDLSVFVSRFRGLAAEHLMHSNASTSSQVGEVLAITLLNNANLEEGTLTNAKLQLISLAEARAENEKDRATKEVSAKALDDLEKIIRKIKDSRIIPPGESTATSNALAAYYRQSRRHCKQLIK